MSEQQHEAADGSAGHSVKIAIAVVGAIGLVIGIYLLAQFVIGTRPLGSGNDKANSEAGIKERIGSVVTIAVDASKVPAPAPGAVATVTAKSAAPVVAMAIPATTPAGTAAKPAGGEGTYKAACSVCHSAGVAGAPKSGDKAAWAPRIAQGKETLYKHAIMGFQGKLGVMPPKGGNTTLADADVKAAVDYMVALNK